MEFHTIKLIKPLENMILEAVFSSGEIKKYNKKDLKKHIKE